MSPEVAVLMSLCLWGWGWWFNERMRRRHLLRRIEYWQGSSGEWERLCGKYEAMAKETLEDLRDLNSIENQSVPE